MIYDMTGNMELEHMPISSDCKGIIFVCEGQSVEAKILSRSVHVPIGETFKIEAGCVRWTYHIPSRYSFGMFRNARGEAKTIDDLFEVLSIADEASPFRALVVAGDLDVPETQAECHRRDAQFASCN